MTHIYREFCNITERSLTSNHYDSQREHIQRKVKTAFSSVLFDSRAFLTSFNLSVDANTFFKLDQKNIGERFVLVDMLWLQIEPLYRGSPEALRHRVEEAFLLLENTITDYVVVCAKGQQINIDFRRATKASTKMIDVSTGLMDTGAHSRHEFEAFERQQGDKA